MKRCFPAAASREHTQHCRGDRPAAWGNVGRSSGLQSLYIASLRRRPAPPSGCFLLHVCGGQRMKWSWVFFFLSIYLSICPASPAKNVRNAGRSEPTLLPLPTLKPGTFFTTGLLSCWFHRRCAASPTLTTSIENEQVPDQAFDLMTYFPPPTVFPLSLCFSSRSGIPTLILLDAEGHMITRQGRVEVLNDPECRLFPWHPRPVLELSESNAVQLHEGPCLVLFVGKQSHEFCSLKGPNLK